MSWVGRFFLGVLTTIILVASLCGVLFALDQSGMLSLQPSVIGVLGKIPGWQDLPKALADGRKESKSWMQKEKAYQAQVARLRQDNEKLQKELDGMLIKKEIPTDEKKRPVTVQTKEKTPLLVAPSASQAALLLADMKAPAAASILLRVAPEVALEILQKMDNRKAAKIMEVMPVENGSALLARLAQNQLPAKARE